ncbi:MAG: Kinase A inhibitor [Marinobacterium sp. xm-d-530]|nr:MAG: Kinase A inhibitor [Marinobacterium sp. xm-d-530]
MHIEIAGESAVIVYFAQEISPLGASQVSAAFKRLEAAPHGIITDLIPSYTSLLVAYDSSLMSSLDITRYLRQQLSDLVVDVDDSADSSVVYVPVYYGEEVGVDLIEVSHQTGLDVNSIITTHTTTEYRVYAIGFAPGFAYLGLTEPQLKVSRRSTPRLKVPRGSVALADNQTAIYPSVSPGGWQIIGRTPMTLVDWSSSPITPFHVGGRVRFRAIDRQEYLDLGGEFDGV